ncbi:MAG: hypothetical protein KAU94_00805 [Verrucomicrobia bacterium]|nr:hypothetical protein [Verrucomicrobiota bacterium]
MRQKSGVAFQFPPHSRRLKKPKKLCCRLADGGVVFGNELMGLNPLHPRGFNIIG